MSCNGDCSNCPMKGSCSSGIVPEALLDSIRKVKEAMEPVQHKILVLSGKGGVGKSTTTYLLTRRLAADMAVGVLDLDLCGPSMPFLFEAEDEKLRQTSLGISPLNVDDNIYLVSTQFFLPEKDEPVIARGGQKNQMVLQLLSDVDWSESEIMMIDTPPGTSDEHLAIVSFMKDAGVTGAVIVTTPEEVALADVRREIRFCKKSQIRVLGVVENMSSYTCPKCGKESSIYPRTNGGAQQMCAEEGVAFLGSIPIDPSLVAGLVGKSHQVAPTVKAAVDSIVEKMMEIVTK